MTRRRFLSLLGKSSLASFLLGTYSFMIERYMVQFNRYKIPVPNLPERFEGFRIAHITDVHYGYLVPLEFLKKLFAKVNSIKTDVVVCTGDYIHERNSVKQTNEIWPELSKLKGNFGEFSVLGNHDHWASTERAIYWLEKSGQNARGKARFVESKGEKLWFVGAGDYLEDHFSLDNVLKEVPEKDCRILLAHNPDTADTDFINRVDLMLAGHTHGGQVILPFYGPPILPVKNKDYTYGLKKSKKGFHMFISRGIGWAMCPVRFNCYPEIPIIELTRQT